ncbi:MAG: hypothetical protein HXS54_00205 [Theionarchaea archaeon]|nr:hypothetical protein [Theionarchaea archaeon]
MSIPSIDALFFEAGLILLSVAMFWYAMVLKELISVLRKPRVWILPVISVFLLLSASIVHFYIHGQLMPLINVDPSIYKDLFEFKTLSMTSVPYRQMLQLRMIEFIFILVGALFSVIAGLLYYKWSRE